MSIKINFDLLWKDSVEYRIQQKKKEWISFLSLLTSNKPLVSLEIGAKYGGTALGLIKLTRSGGHVISIDPIPPRVSSLKKERRRVKYSFFQGSSCDPHVIERVVAYAPFDVLFIDGEHYGDAPTNDFKNFLPYMNPLGIVGFHDIIGKEAVSNIWNRIKLACPGAVLELVSTPHDKNGIGVLFLGKTNISSLCATIIV